MFWIFTTTAYGYINGKYKYIQFQLIYYIADVNYE